MQESVYTTAEIANITGFSLRQLNYWAQKKMITPGFQSAHGSGSRRLYTTEDLVKLNIIRQLKKYNWSTQKIHRAIETLKDIMGDTNPLRNAILFHGKGTIFALSKTREGERILIDALNTTGQQVMSFVLETLLDEIKNTDSDANEDMLVHVDNTPVEVAQIGRREPCN